MIKNYYYFAAGILAIIFSITHALSGQNIVLPSLHIDLITIEIKTIFFYVWHIITAENMLFGIAFLVMSIQKDLSKVKFAAWVIAILMVARWVVIFGATIAHNPSGLKDILVDTIAIAIYVSLIVMGLKVKGKEVEA